MFKRILILCLAVMLSGCGFLGIGGRDLTPAQSSYDAMSKFIAVQIVVEKAVLSPDTPADVKSALKVFEQTARVAVLAYDDAVASGDPGVQSYLSSALKAITEMAAYLARRGLMKSAATGPAGVLIPAEVLP